MRAIGRGKGGRSSIGSSATRAALAIAAIMAVTAAIELAMGRSAICPCGVVRLWHGPVRSPENSQQLFDWYSLSHLVHGLLFYAAARAALPRRLWPTRLALATLVEAAWELLENSPLIIDRYRSVTMAWGYAGDSVLNSMSDIGCMIAGFLLARRLPVRGSVALALGCELLALAVIRDNLTLNVLMLVWPLDAIRQWQAAG